MELLDMVSPPITVKLYLTPIYTLEFLLSFFMMAPSYLCLLESGAAAAAFFS